ncbi:hypothetical protein WDZ17_12950, partial [Pseudokineococcus basanitobsidens]
MPDASRSERPPRRRSVLGRLLGRTAAAPEPSGTVRPAPEPERAVPTSTPAPAVPPPEPTTPLRAVLDGWRSELATTAGQGVLVDDRTAPGVLVAPLDLGGAHPSGLAAFWAGRATRLSSLVRERGAHEAARERVRALRAAAQEVGAAHGLQPGALAVGLVRWSALADVTAGLPAVEVHAPALLQPLVLRPRGAGALDEELDLQPGARVNPALVRLLAARGHRVDVAAVLAPFADGRGDAHRRATGELAAQVAHVPGLELSERTLVGVYPNLAGPLVDDLATLACAADGGLPPLVTALAAASAGRGVGPGGRGGLPAPVRPWGDDARRRLVLDLDEEQERVLDALVAGRSLRVLAQPGTGATQLVAQAVACAVGSGRRCLVVAPALDEALDVADRLDAAGLGDLLLAADRRGTAPRRAAPPDGPSSDGMGTGASGPDGAGLDGSGPSSQDLVAR